ncbi:MAG: hypothetical protein HRJ53_17605 [Acidobacteria bacterium Pan2503]|uniref:Uncharacterized protein n=1 Tax=Candidatus Acidiferrum panamense TaxID=2741543 RepID=A0A7V8NT69_9BACT|nr:hypothetical protein [Candidatus Acidoferrum panamensis]
MSTRKPKLQRKRIVPGLERGSSLIEMMIAALVLLLGVVPLMSVFGVAVSQDAGYVDAATRTGFNAQDKMEQLMALSFADTTADTTVYPTSAVGGTGLGGTMAGNSTAGSVDPAAPVPGYVDYVTFQGALQANAAGATYRRQWSISTDAAGNLKTITVLVTMVSYAGPGRAPSTTLVCMKSNT